jgi:hypothetical protein
LKFHKGGKMKNHWISILRLASMARARIILPLCLLFTCASAWAVIPLTGHSSAQGTPSGNRESSNQQLPVGPAPSGGTGVNPSDYGMCGILGLSGVFSDNLTVAQIIVEPNGYYGVYTNWAKSNPNPPILTWTCVRLTDFTGLPPVSDFATSGPYSLTHSGYGEVSENAGGPDTNACMWAGLEGAFSEAPRDFLYVGGGLDGSMTDPLNVLGVESTATGLTLTTYSFCNTFEAKDFSWNYYESTPLGGGDCTLEDMGALPCIATTVPGPVDTEHYWCYVSGIFGQGPPDDQIDVVKPFSDQLSIGSSPLGASIYFGKLVNSNSFAWNCVKFSE